MILLALIFSTFAIVTNGYLIYLHFHQPKKKKDVYQEEIALFFALMKAYGFKPEESADMLFQYKDYHSLKAANKKAKKYMKPAA